MKLEHEIFTNNSPLVSILPAPASDHSNREPEIIIIQYLVSLIGSLERKVFVFLRNGMLIQIVATENYSVETPALSLSGLIEDQTSAASGRDPLGSPENIRNHYNPSPRLC